MASGSWWVTPSGVVQASSKPTGAVGPFSSEAEANAYVTAHKTKPLIGDEIPGTGGTPDLKPDVPNPLTGINAIGDFFSRLTNSNTWIRAAKILVGGMLVLVGIAHMTGASGAIAETARKVPLPV